MAAAAGLHKYSCATKGEALAAAKQGSAVPHRFVAGSVLADKANPTLRKE